MAEMPPCLLQRSLPSSMEQPSLGLPINGDIQYGDPFVFTPRIQQPGNTIEKHGSSWITFPDVTPGEAEIIVTPPDGNRCGISPGFIESFGQPMKIKTYADSITIVSFVCTGGVELSLES